MITTPQNYLLAAVTGKSVNATSYPRECSNIREVSGRLIYNDDQKSVENTKIKVFVKDFFNIPHYVGSVKTDSKGRFFLRYSWKKGWFDRSQKMTLGIVEKYLPFAKHGFHFKEEVTLENIERQLSLDKRSHDLGIISLTYADIARDVSVVKIPTAVQIQPISYFWKLLKAILPEFVKKAFIFIFGKNFSVETVQSIYDSFGPSYPKRASTPENLIDELLNHVSAVDPLISGNQVTWSANWDGLEFDKIKSLPNVTVRAIKQPDNTLKLESISVKFRVDKNETTVELNDENIHWAIYLARSAFCLKGEAEVHLGEGHILPSIPAKVFFKHIKPENPIFAPMEPHLTQLDFINWFGSRGLIFGTGSVLDTSALTDKAIANVIISAMKRKSNWIDYQPPKPIVPAHYLASAETLHFNLLLSFFNQYIQKNKEEIAIHWSAIHNWSEGVSDLIDTLPKITTNKENPTEDDFKRLGKFLAWLVTKTTFVHWASHSRQQLLTDVRQASLAIEERGLDKNGHFNPYGNTTPKNAGDQLNTARVLMNFEGDSLFTDPNGDMNQELLKLLRKHLPDYKGFGDIEKMHITAQI